MKSLEQLKAEAKLRQAEIAKKNAKMTVTKCGNVKSSFGRNSMEFLSGMGFFVKGSDRKPSKDAWIDKKLDKNIISIHVRKKAE